MTLTGLLAVATSGDSGDGLTIALISLAGAALGAFALIYTSRYRAEHPASSVPAAPQAPPTDLSMSAFQTYEQFREMSRRMDRSDDRIERLENQVDHDTRRIDRLAGGNSRPSRRQSGTSDDE